MPIDDPLLVGISGGSGAGKTFILKQLYDHYGPGEISVVSQDQYYLPLPKQPVDEAGVHNFDEPVGIDSQALYHDIMQLISGQRVSKWEYSFNNPFFKPTLLHTAPAPILVVEGLFVFHFKAIARLLDLRFFVQAPECLSLERRIKRDWNERALNEAQVRYQWEKHFKPAYERYLLPYAGTCDYVLHNDNNNPDITPMLRLIDKNKESTFRNAQKYT